MTRHLRSLVPVLVLFACDRAPPPADSASTATATTSKPTTLADGGYDRPFAPVEIEVGAAAKTAADQMLTRVQNGLLHDDDRTAGDPEALAWVAATATNPMVVGDAILGLAITEKTPPPAAATVIAARLRCTDPDVLQGVADALTDMTRQPTLAADANVIAAIVDAAQHHPNEVVKTQALASLWGLPLERKERSVAVQALDGASPTARLRLVLEAMLPDREDPLRADIVARLVPLTSHAEPAVRGIAARRLGGLDDGESTRARLVALLGDETPYVRCQALEGLASLRKSAKVLVGPVAAQLDDTAACTLKLDHPTIRGAVESVEIGSPVVLGLRAAYTLASFSLESEDRLTIGSVMNGDAAALAKEISAAKAWAQRQG